MPHPRVTIRCPERATLARLLPTLLRRQDDELRNMIDEHNYFSLFFDGATRLGELVAIIVRMITTDLVPVHRVLALQTMPYSVDAAALAGLLQSKLQHFGVGFDNAQALVSITHDSAAVNRAATRNLVC